MSVEEEKLEDCVLSLVPAKSRQGERRLRQGKKGDGTSRGVGAK